MSLSIRKAIGKPGSRKLMLPRTACVTLCGSRCETRSPAHQSMNGLRAGKKVRRRTEVLPRR